MMMVDVVSGCVTESRIPMGGYDLHSGYRKGEEKSRRR